MRLQGPQLRSPSRPGQSHRIGRWHFRFSWCPFAGKLLQQKTKKTHNLHTITVPICTSSPNHYLKRNQMQSLLYVVEFQTHRSVSWASHRQPQSCQKQFSHQLHSALWWPQWPGGWGCNQMQRGFGAVLEHQCYQICRYQIDRTYPAKYITYMKLCYRFKYTKVHYWSIITICFPGHWVCNTNHLTKHWGCTL